MSTSIPTKYIRTKYADRAECTHEFDVYTDELVLEEAQVMQETNDSAVALIDELLGVPGAPCEGNPGESISFRVDGLGFYMIYTSKPYEHLRNHYVVSDVHVYRDARWDEKETEYPTVTVEQVLKNAKFAVCRFIDDEFAWCSDAFDQEDEAIAQCEEHLKLGFDYRVMAIDRTAPAITFATPEEYDAQCELCTQSGIDTAARKVWETLKAEAEYFWEQEEGFRANGGLPIGAMKSFKSKLKSYKKVFEALGCCLEYKTDWADPAKRVWEITLASGEKTSASGCLRCWPKSNW